MPSDRVMATLNAIAAEIPAQRARIEDLGELIDIKRANGQVVTEDTRQLAEARRQLEMWISTLKSKGAVIPG